MGGMVSEFALFNPFSKICENVPAVSSFAVMGFMVALTWAGWSRGIDEPNRLAPAADSPDAELGTHKIKLRREGTELRDEPGHFLVVGARINFMSAAGEQLIALENLNLERIGRIMTSTPDSVEWLVSGTVTEFQGGNYLWVKRATRKMKAGTEKRGGIRGPGTGGKDEG